MALGSAYVSEPVAKVWYGAKEAIPGVRLGGVYADKKGYHNTRKRNLQRWPGEYSTRLSMDLKGPSLLSSAIDLTMSDTQMRRRTGYLRRSALDPNDTRLYCLREFIGTLDGKKVYCRIGGNSGLGQGRGSDDWGRDSSHLWHIHLSILRAYANDWRALEGVLSVLVGETWSAWRQRKGGALPSIPAGLIAPAPTLHEGDTGAGVRLLQAVLNALFGLGLAEDGVFGPNTTTAVKTLQHRAGLTPDGIYGRDSASALRDLLEDDMSWDQKIKTIRNQGVGYSDAEWPASFMLSSAHFYTLKYGQAMLAEQAAAKKREEAILAAVKGVDTKTILAAIERAAVEDAARDRAAADALAEIASLVAQVGSGQLAADAVVDLIAERIRAE